jgi:hypothetical protein
MNDVLRFLTQYEVLFYILFGLVILIYVRKVYLAWQDWSVAMFGLEKEVTQRKINAGLTFIFLSALLGIGLFIINTFCNTLCTRGFSGVHAHSEITPEVTVMETENPTPEVTQQGIVPTINAFLERGCVPGQIGWTYPLDGDGISGQVELKGTVKISNLGYYKVEYYSF